MAEDFVIRKDLEDAIQDVMDLGLSDNVFSIEEVLSIVFKFNAAVMNAVFFCVITPEEGRILNIWLASMFEL